MVISEQLCRKTKLRGKHICYLDIFLDASNLNNLQVTELKFAEFLDMVFVWMCVTK